MENTRVFNSFFFTCFSIWITIIYLLNISVYDKTSYIYLLSFYLLIITLLFLLIITFIDFRVNVFTAVLLIPFMQTVEIPVIGPKATLSELLILFAGIGFCFETLKNKFNGKPLASFACMEVIIPFFFLIGGAAFSLSGVSLSNDGKITGMFEILTFFYLGAFVFLILQAVDSEKRFMLLLNMLLISFSIVLVFGLLTLFWMKVSFLPKDLFLCFIPFGRLITTFRNPNYFASFLLGFAPLVYIFAYRCYVQNNTTKIIYFLSAASFLLVFFLSYSSAGYVAFPIFLFLLCKEYLKGIKFKRVLLLAIFIVFILLIFSLFIVNDSSNINVAKETIGKINVSNSEAQVRFNLWNYGISLFKEAPLFGTGAGVMYFWAKEVGGTFGRSHNTFFTTLAEMGMFGVSCLIVFIYMTFKRLFKVYKYSNNPLYKNIAYAIFVSLVSLSVFGMFHDIFRHKHIWVLYAITALMYRFQTENKKEGLSL